MKYVIVFIHEMNRDGISMAPTLFAHATTRTTYSKIAFITASMAEFLRGLGYNAIASANETALNTPLAIDAGLGQLSRQAKLINPTYGPRCRISKVFTDMPLFTDRPIDFGVTRFCSTCLKCARACPRHCIPTGPPSYEPKGDYSHDAVLQWQLDHMKCREYFTAVGTNCGLCLVACPLQQAAPLGPMVHGLAHCHHAPVQQFHPLDGRPAGLRQTQERQRVLDEDQERQVVGPVISR